MVWCSCVRYELSRSRFLDRRDIDFFIAQSIFRSPRYRFFIAQSIFRSRDIDFSSRSRFLDCRAVDFVIPLEVDFFIAAISIFSLPHSKNRFHPPDGDSRLTAMLSRFCPERQLIRMSTGVIHNVIFGQRAGLPLSWLKTC